MHSPIRIGLIADHLIFRIGVVQALSCSPRLMVVAQGSTFDDAIQIAAQPDLDLILLEIEIPGDGLAAARMLRQRGFGGKVIIITALENEELVVDALRAGVRGYILKYITGPELVRALDTIYDGELYISPALASRMLNRLITKSRALLVKQDLTELTSRERQVLAHIAQGLTNREIAAQLGITLKTIKRYVSMLFGKLGVRNRTQAIAAIRDDKVLLPYTPHGGYDYSIH